MLTHMNNWVRISTTMFLWSILFEDTPLKSCHWLSLNLLSHNSLHHSCQFVLKMAANVIPFQNASLILSLLVMLALQHPALSISHHHIIALKCQVAPYGLRFPPSVTGSLRVGSKQVGP